MPPGRSIRSFLYLLLVFLTPVALSATDRRDPIVVQDPEYGEALFYFYQEDYFPALVRLLAAKEQERLTHHADDLSRIESDLAADELSHHADHQYHHLVLDLLIKLLERPVEHADNPIESLDRLPDLRPPLLEPFTVAIGLTLPAALLEALAVCRSLDLVQLCGRQQATGLLDRRFTLP